MNEGQNTYMGHTSSVQVDGTVVRLIFAPQGNTETIAVVKNILKDAYLRSQRV